MAFPTTLIEKNRQAWLSRLVDTTRRNNLLFFITDNPGKVFDLRQAGDDQPAKLLELEAVTPLKNIRAEVLNKQSSSLRQIVRRARINQEERSIQTLFVAHGLFCWPSEEGGREYCAPALLFPVEVRTEAGSKSGFKLQLTGEVELNRPLLVLWNRQYGIDSSAVEALSDAADPETPTEKWIKSLEDIRKALENAGSVIKGLRTEEGTWLSNFSFQKLGLVQDLEKHKTSSYAHPLVAALCGEPDARRMFTDNGDDFPPSAIDSLPADDDFTFLPCDSSQFTVIRNVLAGKSGVIQGPPGTGKSQTIANLIAELVARGKRVLFVAEKKAALDVVFDRLNKSGLGDMVLNLHGGDLRGKKLAAQLSKGLEVLRSPATTSADGTLSEWEKIRRDLVEHVELLHNPLPPWNLSPYACMDWLMGHPEIPHPGLRIQASSLEQVSPALKKQMMELLEEFGRMEERMSTASDIGWKDALPDDTMPVLELFERMENLLSCLEEIDTWYVKYSSANRLTVPTTRHELNEQCSMLNTLAELYILLKPGSLSVDCSQEFDLLSGYRDKPLKRMAGGLFSGSYNRAVSKVTGLFLRETDLFNEALPVVERMMILQRFWNGSPPEKAGGREELNTLLKTLEDGLKWLSIRIPPTEKVQAPAKLKDLLRSLLEDRDKAYLVPKMYELKSSLEKTGLDRFVEQCRTAGISHTKWADSFEQLYYRSILSIMKSRDPRLAAFDGRRQDEKRRLFRELDKKRQSLAVSRIRRQHAERMTLLLNRFPGQETALRSQAQRKYPWPFKRIFSNAPDVLLSVFPCWMASPLTITQFIDAGTPPFDVVFFDEASQVQPEDAVSCILRGRQLVVSGDTRQLPPTNFFADGDAPAGEEPEEGQPATSGYESLLHLMLGTLPGLGPAGDGWFLRWHYRSRDEALIAFSNEHIYNGRMVTFPRPSTERAVHFIHVDPSVSSDVGQDSSTPEVLRVKELVMDLARKHPHKSLGVIALGLEHATRLEEAIDTAIEQADEQTRTFFSENNKEPFFVKNLERVQGDERDIVILSVGYGQNRTGTLSHNFGPINQDGGERRLNVAITRSREQMWVVASFDPSELNPERTKGAGPELLRKYLLYAKSGGRDLGLDRPTGMPENFFEQDIRTALEEKGMQVTSQYGVSGYRIDLVVHHPRRPGEFIMAVECDGAAYHSSPCARDRDRLRQEFLEGMGWNFHRIWSTDWFSNRNAEVERAVQRYEELLAVEEAKKDEKNNQDAGRKIPQQEPVPEANENGIPKTTKGERPPIPRYDSIGDYQDRELFLLAQWIMSDGVLRTDQLLFEDLFEELGFKRKGPAITARLQDIIRRLKG